MAAGGRTAARRSARGNRWGLAFVGVLLAGGGAAAIATGQGAFGPRLAGTALAEGVAAAVLTWPWLTYAAAAAAILVALVALRWLLAQARTDTVSRVTIDTEPVDVRGGDAGAVGAGPAGAAVGDAGTAGTAGRTEMLAVAARAACDEEIADYPGVRRARTHITESPRSPRVRVDLAVEDDTDVTALWQRIREEALEHLRSTLELDHLPAVIRITAAGPARDRGRVV